MKLGGDCCFLLLNHSLKNYENHLLSTESVGDSGIKFIETDYMTTKFKPSRLCTVGYEGNFSYNQVFNHQKKVFVIFGGVDENGIKYLAEWFKNINSNFQFNYSTKEWVLLFHSMCDKLNAYTTIIIPFMDSFDMEAETVIDIMRVDVGSLWWLFLYLKNLNVNLDVFAILCNKLVKGRISTKVCCLCNLSIDISDLLNSLGISVVGGVGGLKVDEIFDDVYGHSNSWPAKLNFGEYPGVGVVYSLKRDFSQLSLSVFVGHGLIMNISFPKKFFVKLLINGKDKKVSYLEYMYLHYTFLDILGCMDGIVLGEGVSKLFSLSPHNITLFSEEVRMIILFCQVLVWTGFDGFEEIIDKVKFSLFGGGVSDLVDGWAFLTSKQNMLRSFCLFPDLWLNFYYGMFGDKMPLVNNSFYVRVNYEKANDRLTLYETIFKSVVFKYFNYMLLEDKKKVQKHCKEESSVVIINLFLYSIYDVSIYNKEDFEKLLGNILTE